MSIIHQIRTNWYCMLKIVQRTTVQPSWLLFTLPLTESWENETWKPEWPRSHLETQLSLVNAVLADQPGMLVRSASAAGTTDQATWHCTRLSIQASLLETNKDAQMSAEQLLHAESVLLSSWTGVNEFKTTDKRRSQRRLLAFGHFRFWCRVHA